MERIWMPVNTPRRYDASRRRAQARRTQESVLGAARQRLLRDGYATTTVAMIAADAGTSVDTIYKTFGGKAGLVRTLWLHALEGDQATPAPTRSDRLSKTEMDPARVLRGWGQFTTELAPRVAPILLLVRAAAATDPDMAALLEEIEIQRRTRMRHNARRLQQRSWLRPGVTLAEATDILWTYSSSELYDLLVLRSGWPAERYGAFVGDALIAALLPARATTTAATGDR
jgi:AcrR family transcriptional regulator